MSLIKVLYLCFNWYFPLAGRFSEYLCWCILKSPIFRQPIYHLLVLDVDCIYQHFSDTVTDTNSVYVLPEVYIPPVLFFQSVYILKRLIRNIDIHAFEGLQSLKNIYITSCQLSKAPPIRPLAKTLVILNLVMNNITHIPPEYFHGFDLLERVFLSHNSIKYLPEMHHLNRSLMCLKLDWNRLEDIKPLYFVSFEKLKRLYLDHNFLTNLSFETTVWPVMEIVTLRHNLLSTINPFRRMTKGETGIFLSNNLLHCNRELCWLGHCKDMQKANYQYRALVCSLYRARKVIYYDLTCNSPTERNMTRIFESGTVQNRNLMWIYH